MSNIKESLAALMKVEGAKAVALVDSASGMMLGRDGDGINLDVAAAGNTEVVRSMLKTIKALGLKDSIDDMLISLTSQYHLIRPLAANPAMFLYLVLDRSKSNLAMARYRLTECDAQLVV